MKLNAAFIRHSSRLLRRWLLTFGLVAVFVCMTTTTILAQDAGDSGRIPTVEELFLRSPDLGATLEQAFSTDRETKLLALDDIEAMIDEGTTGGNEETISDLLTYLSAEGTLRTAREGRRLVNYFPVVRRRAVELMGQLGRDTADEQLALATRSSLLEILIKDQEVMIKSEAAYALGLLGKDEQGEVIRVLADLITRQSYVAPDNNFAFAVAVSIEKIAEQNKGMKDYRGYTALVTIMQGNYTRKVKDKAFEVLQSLKNYR